MRRFIHSGSTNPYHKTPSDANLMLSTTNLETKESRPEEVYDNHWPDNPTIARHTIAVSRTGTKQQILYVLDPSDRRALDGAPIDALV